MLQKREWVKVFEKFLVGEILLDLRGGRI